MKYPTQTERAIRYGLVDLVSDVVEAAVEVVVEHENKDRRMSDLFDVIEKKLARAINHMDGEIARIEQNHD